MSSSSNESRKSQFSPCVVDEDDVGGKRKKQIVFYLNTSRENFVLKPIGFEKLGHSSEKKNDTLILREGLEGWCLDLRMWCWFNNESK